MMTQTNRDGLPVTMMTKQQKWPTCGNDEKYNRCGNDDKGQPKRPTFGNENKDKQKWPTCDNDDKTTEMALLWQRLPRQQQWPTCRNDDQKKPGNNPPVAMLTQTTEMTQLWQ